MGSTRSLPRFMKALLVTGASYGGFLCYYLPNTEFLNNLQVLTQSYKDKVPIPVSEKVKVLFDEVLHDMKMEEHRECILPYTSWGFEFYHAGSVWKNSFFDRFKKAIVGIPQYFYWENLSEEQKERLMFQGKKLNWSAENTKKLEHSLLISDEAKKFGLAQNLYYVSTYEPLYNGVVTAVLLCITILYVHSILQSKKFQHERFKRVRLTFSGLIVLLNLVMWSLLKDAFRCHLERDADQAVAKLGKSYIEGGLEYYNSVLERNVTLRNMIANEGSKSPFSLFGNEKITFRQRHLPLTERRDYFKKLLDK